MQFLNIIITVRSHVKIVELCMLQATEVTSDWYVFRNIRTRSQGSCRTAKPEFKIVRNVLCSVITQTCQEKSVICQLNGFKPDCNQCRSSAKSKQAPSVAASDKWPGR